jgi:hypothetical protein
MKRNHGALNSTAIGTTDDDRYVSFNRDDSPYYRSGDDASMADRTGSTNPFVVDPKVYGVDRSTGQGDFLKGRGVGTEPTGCLGFAGLHRVATDIKGRRVGVIISGGNSDLDQFANYLAS